ncbi:MAG TPA: 2-C-methyl-D-erythritol 4-phosphate cytidylyltransferase [Pyrinomonadaceae bacterium]|jgi:2-C-methyl-D-erythritol 4-phosphate cytidylyltransferase
MNIAIIAAAGQGTRLRAGRAKQFLELDGVPVIIHTLRRFEQCAAIDEIIVVLPAPDVAGFLAVAAPHELRKLARVVAGGGTRAESVWRGLQAVRAATAEILAVHDGVRPFVTADEISRTVAAAQRSGAAILAAPAIDTIKEVQDGQVRRTLQRDSLRHALTPQCFRYALLREAYERAKDLGAAVTDDSFLIEQLGISVAVVEGSARNIKITRPEDLAFAEILVKQNSEFRIQKSE